MQLQLRGHTSQRSPSVTGHLAGVTVGSCGVGVAVGQHALLDTRHGEGVVEGRLGICQR